ncbi:MAG: hypothetical protein HFG16_01885, partial [Erysipelotrichaceae bacterium]|nr:hypothetical protein [Erysipelotrichaceae bacterium]
MYTTGDTRIWSSSLPFSSSKWGLPNIAFSFGNNGGMDLMFAAGEPDVHAFTMGSQRPAL